MTTLISKAVARLGSLLKEIQVKQFFAIALVGVLVFMTSPEMPRGRNTADLGRNGQAVTKKIDRVIHQGDSERPKTTREWQNEAARTEDAPAERAKEIIKESADAIQDFGGVYPSTAKRSVRAAQEND